MFNTPFCHSSVSCSWIVHWLYNNIHVANVLTLISALYCVLVFHAKFMGNAYARVWDHIVCMRMCLCVSDCMCVQNVCAYALQSACAHGVYMRMYMHVCECIGMYDLTKYILICILMHHFSLSLYVYVLVWTCIYLYLSACICHKDPYSTLYVCVCIVWMCPGENWCSPDVLYLYVCICMYDLYRNMSYKDIFFTKYILLHCLLIIFFPRKWYGISIKNNKFL